ncbi:AmpG family muropeptide MFS transporter [Oleiharenicola lentus]|uniref:AmpG family muropeptide MFS transporter n=1 Tax=Oleiharenicola lentus TaxID=2508720 RepID=UPI003F6794CA
MENPAAKSTNPWSWVPTLYFAQGIPYVAVMTLSVVMYKNLKVSNTDIALYTSWLYLPWVIKPLWSPLVDLFRTKRFWIVALQFVVGGSLALVALTLPGPMFFKMTLAIFWLMAFSSATHDIAADGFYLLALPEHQQAAFVGVRSTFYRLAMIAGQGGLVYLAGSVQEWTGDFVRAWTIVFGVLAVFFVVIAAVHSFTLPKPASDVTSPRKDNFFASYFTVFAEFFKKKEILSILAFLLLYRLAEAQLLKLVNPFLLDARDQGGLGLTVKHVGVVYGTVGPIALTLGGLAGGVVISRFGLKRMIWPMLVIMHVPNAVFILLATTQPENLLAIGSAVAVEQFGYGFGFTAYMVYMMMVAQGEHKTAHYALCTGFMALGMMLPGMAAGWIQDHVGYVNFFVWVMIATIPSFVAAAFLKIDPAFGKKAEAAVK